MIAVLIASLVMSFVCLAVGVMGIILAKQMIKEGEDNHEILAEQSDELETKIEELKSALAVVNKLHQDRLTDLDPLENRMAVLEVKVNAVSSNQRR